MMTVGALNRLTRYLLVPCFGVAIGLAASVTSASGDPIGLTNSSYISGNVLAAVNPDGAYVADSYSTFGQDTLPLSGSATLRDARTVSIAGSSAAVSTYVTTDLASSRLAGTGQFTGITTGALPVSGAAVYGASVVSLMFNLREPHAYRFTGAFSLDHQVDPGSFGGDGHLGAGAQLLRSNSDQVFYDLFEWHDGPGLYSRRHAGMLDPGLYTLRANASGDFSVFRGTNNAVLGYDVSLDLAPIAPVPEPTTFMLVGTGLVGLAARAWRRKNTPR